MKVYAMSDIHGCLNAFERALALVEPHLGGAGVRLFLLGDYVHGGPSSFAVLERIMGLQERWGADVVVALRGNHEQMVLDGEMSISPDGDEPHRFRLADYLDWMRGLPLLHVVGHTIFVHAGIDEEAGDLWRWGTSDELMLGKYPPVTGPFLPGWTIVAGHAGTHQLAGDPAFHDVWWDGQAHYFIDGSTTESGVVPVLLADFGEGAAGDEGAGTGAGEAPARFWQVRDDGLWSIPAGE